MSHLMSAGVAHIYKYTKKDGSTSFYPYFGSYCIGTFDSLESAIQRREEVKAERKELAEKRKAIKVTKKDGNKGLAGLVK